MKKIYIKPESYNFNLQLECYMETFSLPKTGEVDDPSVGQGKSRADYIEEDEEMEMIMNQDIDDNGSQNQLW